MRVDVADAFTMQGVPLDEMEDFRLGRDDGVRKQRQGGKGAVAVDKIAQGKLAEDKRMDQHAPCVE